MTVLSLKSKILRDVSNIPGWRTDRKLVVIESDDWGSVRMSSTEAFEKLKLQGVDESNNHYNRFDSIESNEDLKQLFDVLKLHKDKNGNHPVITCVGIVANPDFEQIRCNGFSSYVYEPFTETLKRYPAHDEVYDLYKKGIQEHLFVPIFHGREHLNVSRWMNALQIGHKTTHAAFEQGVTGVYCGINGEKVPNYQAAFDVDESGDILPLKEVLSTGLDLFENLFGYTAEYFVPTNGPFNNELETILYEKGVRFINSAKIQREPLGNGKYKRNFRFLGKKNQFGQLYITRNCFFEPSSMEHKADTDWISNCLSEIESAFRWRKPAVISSHRVNYMGFLHPENRQRGLSQMNMLLSEMLKRWPDIEFVTSVELGNIIFESGNGR